MPELPDVEVYRRYLAATALHQAIAHVHVEAPRVLVDTTAQGLGRRLGGQSFERASRHGKYLFAQLDGGGAVALHFGMTGRLDYRQEPDAGESHAACRFEFRNGARLDYLSTRLLGRIEFTESVADFIHAKGLGPDALALDRDDFLEDAASRRGGVKSWLMDQGHIAGIGNVYSDEILFRAGIHPKRKVSELDDDVLRELHRAIDEVLQAAIAAKADPARMPDRFILPRREPGGHCPRCGAALEQLSVNGRTAWFCPECQPG